MEGSGQEPVKIEIHKFWRVVRVDGRETINSLPGVDSWCEAAREELARLQGE